MSGINNHFLSKEIKKSTNRTRFRVPKSCSSCRKRKIKCDRQRPYCSSCIKEGSIECCKYETLPWQIVSSTDQANNILMKEVEHLRLKVKYLESELGSSNNSITTNTGISSKPSTDASLQKECQHESYNTSFDDTLIDLSRDFSGLTVKDYKLLYITPTSCISLIMNDEYANRMFQKYKDEQLRIFKKHNPLPQKNTSQCGNLKLLESDKNFNSNPDDIPNDLPPWGIISLLLERFFFFCYPFAPYVDQQIFMKEISYILVDEGSYTSINARGRIQYGVIASLLIMMRLAFLTLPLKDYYANTLTGEIYDLTHEIIKSRINISSSYVNRATFLIYSSSCFKNISLSTIQAALLLRIYKSYCPEEYEGGTDSGILVGITIQMARFQGLHSDPFQYSTSLVDDKSALLWRNIWTELSYLDASSAFNVGSILVIHGENMEQPDTDINQYDMNEDHLYIVEQLVIKAAITKATRKIVRVVEKKERKIKRTDVIEFVSDIREILFSRIRTFEQLYKSDTGSYDRHVNERASEFKIRLDLIYKLFCSYTILYNSASEETEEVLMKDYLSSALECGLIIYRIASEFSKNSSAMFGSELETIICSSILLPCMRITINVGSILMRMLNGEFSMIEASKSFKSPDSHGLLAWFNMDYENDIANARQLYRVLKELHVSSYKFNNKFLLSYMFSAYLKYVLNYLAKCYPETEKETFSNQDEIVSKDFSEIEQFWNNKLNSYPSVSLDYVFSNFDDGLDTFLSDIPDDLKIFD